MTTKNEAESYITNMRRARFITNMRRARFITNMRRARFWLPRTARWLRRVSSIVNGAKFDLNLYGTSSPRSVAEASSCGFRGCAAGWATLEPSHRRAGLRLMGDYGASFPVFASRSQSLSYSMWALSDFYGIGYDVAFTLFGGPDTDWREGKTIDSDDEVDLISRHDPIAAAERIERFCGDMGITLLE